MVRASVLAVGAGGLRCICMTWGRGLGCGPGVLAGVACWRCGGQRGGGGAAVSGGCLAESASQAAWTSLKATSAAAHGFLSGLTELCQQEDTQEQEEQSAQHHGEDEAGPEACNQEPTTTPPCAETSSPAATIRKVSSDNNLQGKRPAFLLLF
ncbi:unnamed protein product [Urochloa humidicola]